MQLRDLAAALRKSENVDDKLRALRNLEGALLAAPDELKHYASKPSLTLPLATDTLTLLQNMGCCMIVHPLAIWHIAIYS